MRLAIERDVPQKPEPNIFRLGKLSSGRTRKAVRDGIDTGFPRLDDAGNREAAVSDDRQETGWDGPAPNTPLKSRVPPEIRIGSARASTLTVRYSTPTEATNTADRVMGHPFLTTMAGRSKRGARRARGRSGRMVRWLDRSPGVARVMDCVWRDSRLVQRGRPIVRSVRSRRNVENGTAT